MFCRHCGTKMEEGWWVCPNCGTRLNSQPKASQKRDLQNSTLVKSDSLQAEEETVVYAKWKDDAESIYLSLTVSSIIKTAVLWLVIILLECNKNKLLWENYLSNRSMYQFWDAIFTIMPLFIIIGIVNIGMICYYAAEAHLSKQCSLIITNRGISGSLHKDKEFGIGPKPFQCVHGKYLAEVKGKKLKGILKALYGAGAGLTYGVAIHMSGADYSFLTKNPDAVLQKLKEIQEMSEDFN